MLQPLLHTLASTRMGNWRRFSEQKAGWTLVLKKGTKKKLSKKSLVGNLKRSAVFFLKKKLLKLTTRLLLFFGVSQEHEVAKAPRTLVCPQRRVSVPVRRTESPCVAQAPTCPDPSRRVRYAVGGRLRPARVLPCEDESLDHVTTVHFCDLEDGIQGARHGVPASAGLASSSRVGGSRSAGDRFSSRSGPGAHATTGESERIIWIA